jgi:hypothetical protein
MYALCMTSEEVVYKSDMQSDEVHVARTARNPMQSAVVLAVNTIIPPVLEGKKDGIREFKHDFNAAKTYEEWLPQNSHGGTCRNLQGGVKRAFEHIKGAISQSIGQCHLHHRGRRFLPGHHGEKWGTPAVSSLQGVLLESGHKATR